MQGLGKAAPAWEGLKGALLPARPLGTEGTVQGVICGLHPVYWALRTGLGWVVH